MWNCGKVSDFSINPQRSGSVDARDRFSPDGERKGGRSSLWGCGKVSDFSINPQRSGSADARGQVFPGRGTERGEVVFVGLW